MTVDHTLGVRGIAAVLAALALTGACVVERAPAEETEVTTSVRASPELAVGGGRPSTVTALAAEPAAAPPPAPGQPNLARVAVRLTPIATLAQPSAMAVRFGDPALYVAERSGAVWAIRDGVVGAEPFVDITGETTTDAERGLLGIAFSPDGMRMYLSFTDELGDTRLDEISLDQAGVPVPYSRRVVLTLDQPFSNHNGGHIAFGPEGLLYLGLGDGGSANDPFGNGQRLDTLLGKILRIDPTQEGAQPYRIPGDNPFVGAEGARAEIWAYGLRNPWRFAFDRATGEMWVSDVGQDASEEVTLLGANDAGAGANLGWSLVEGSRVRSEAGPPDGHVPPMATYGHDEGCSIIGGFAYRGQAIPDLQGAYVFSDFCNGRLQALAQSAGRLSAVADLGLRVENLVSFGEDANGELYALSLSGQVLRLDPA